ncbi:hypothetical protein Vretimale_2365 [Volvox reticuliferus]|nr:hypothetical protein Vretimale_2365 [Volvox reticuliferus]
MAAAAEHLSVAILAANSRSMISNLMQAGKVNGYRHSFARTMQTHRAATPVASGATTATATPLSLQPSSTSSQQPLGASTTKTLPATLKLSASTGQASPSSVESSDMSTSGIAGSIPNLSPAPTADLGSPTCSLQLQSGTLLPLLSGPYYGIFPSTVGLPTSSAGNSCDCSSSPFTLVWGKAEQFGNRTFYALRLFLTQAAPPSSASRGQLSQLVIQIDPKFAARCYQVNSTVRRQPFKDRLFFRPTVPWSNSDPVGIPVNAVIGYSTASDFLELSLDLSDLRRQVMNATGLPSTPQDVTAEPLTRGVFLLRRCLNKSPKILCNSWRIRDVNIDTCITAYVWEPPPPPSLLPPPNLRPPPPKPSFSPPSPNARITASEARGAQQPATNPRTPRWWSIPRMTITFIVDAVRAHMPPETQYSAGARPPPQSPQPLKFVAPKLNARRLGTVYAAVDNGNSMPAQSAALSPGNSGLVTGSPYLMVCYSVLALGKSLLVTASPPPPPHASPSSTFKPEKVPPRPPPASPRASVATQPQSPLVVNPSPAPPRPSPPRYPKPPPSPRSPPSPKRPPPSPPRPPPSPPRPPPAPHSLRPLPPPPKPPPSPSRNPPSQPPPRTSSPRSSLSPELLLRPQFPRLPKTPPGHSVPLPVAPAYLWTAPPPPPPGVDGGVEYAQCSVTSGGMIYTDGDQFPFGIFHSSVCSCGAAPYGLRFGGDTTVKNVTYHTFRLYNKPCDEGAVAMGAGVCNTIRPVINKIAFRIDSDAAICYNQTDSMTFIENATNFRGVRFWQDGTSAPGDWLPARVGITADGRHIELYIYGLKFSYTDGMFLLTKCGAMGSFSRVCRGTAEGMCLFAFVDTPGHRFATVCKAQGLT